MTTLPPSPHLALPPFSKTETERERERGRAGDRQRGRESERQREQESERARQRESERARERESEREITRPALHLGKVMDVQGGGRPVTKSGQGTKLGVLAVVDLGLGYRCVGFGSRVSCRAKRLCIALLGDSCSPNINP